MSYEPLHHKYRPQTFAELVGQDAIATTLASAIRQNKIAPAYLFTGPRGTGKTSSARIMAKSLNCLNSPAPTEKPCGVCDVCRSITNGSSLDVIEIDAASNTGVDNIRELIERAQFAPVQCRHKVYIIDECLAGDSLVLTSEGLMRIDDPAIKGKKVLSYNESSGEWEFRNVLRWFDQGDRETFVINTTNREIRCTGNHLLRSSFGWVQAKDLTKGMTILSPVNVGATPSFPSIKRMDALYSSRRDIITGSATSQLFSSQLNHFVPKTLVVENGVQTSSNISSRTAWGTSLERIDSVKYGVRQRVYDIEVECNHNFVANGLLLHNCHSLSSGAFNALLKTLEEPPKQVVFVLATTDIQRVLQTIISRCQRFDFIRIPLEAMVQHLQEIATKEKINITGEALLTVAQIAQGGLRDAESLLDQLSLFSGQVTVERVWDLVGAVPEKDLMGLLEAIASSNPSEVLDRVRSLMNRGREPLIVLQNLASFYRDLLIAKTAPNRSDLVAMTPQTWEQLCKFASVRDVGTILAGQQLLRASEAQIKNTTQPRLWLEVTLLGLLSTAEGAEHSASNASPTAGRSTTQAIAPKQTPPSYGGDGSGRGDRPQDKAVEPRAIETGKNAANLEPQDWMKQGLALLVAQRYDEAIAAFDKAIEINPKLPEPWYYKIEALEASNRMDEAMACSDRACELHPNYTHTKSNATGSQAKKPEPAEVEAHTPPTSGGGVPAAPPQPEGDTTPTAAAQMRAIPVSAQPDDLKQIWQEVISQLPPICTPGLLHQRSSLQNLTEQEAIVLVTGQPFLTKVGGKRREIEEAFFKVLNRRVNVRLVPTPTEPTSTPPVQNPQTPGSPPAPDSGEKGNFSPMSSPKITPGGETSSSTANQARAGEEKRSPSPPHSLPTPPSRPPFTGRESGDAEGMGPGAAGVGGASQPSDTGESPASKLVESSPNAESSDPKEGAIARTNDKSSSPKAPFAENEGGAAADSPPPPKGGSQRDTPKMYSEEDEVTVGATRVANFFKGEILTLPDNRQTPDLAANEWNNDAPFNEPNTDSSAPEDDLDF